MPKRRDGIMTVRIPTDEKDVLQAIADHLDLTLSDVVVQAVRGFIASNKGALKKSSAKPAAIAPTKPVGKTPAKPAAKAPAKATPKASAKPVGKSKSR